MVPPDDDTAERLRVPPSRLAREERRRLVAELRRSGATYQAIADQVGTSPQAVHQLLKRALKAALRQTDHEVALLRAQEVDRVDRVMLTFWRKALDGDPRAANVVLRCITSRKELLGLAPPTKVAPTTPDGDEPYEPPVPADPGEALRELLAIIDAGRARDTESGSASSSS